MAIRLKSFTTMANAGTSLTMSAFPDIATDDFILVCLGKDGNTGTWAESGSSDYTAGPSNPAGGGAVYVAAFYRKATSGSEVPRIFDSGVSDDCGGFVTVWEGVDTTTPFGDTQADTFGSSVASFTPTALTTTANNSALIWFPFADSGRGLDMEPGLMGLAPAPFMNGVSGANCELAWTIQETSGASITPEFAMSQVETGQVLSFALSPAVTTDAPPYIDHANPPSTIVHTFRGNGSTGNYGGALFDPTGTVTDIDGETTTYDAAIQGNGMGAGGTNDSVSIVYSSGDTGLRVSGWTLTSTDLSGETLSVQMGTFSEFRRFASTANKGYVFGLRSGTVDYMFWAVGGADSDPQFTTFHVGVEIEIDGGGEIDEIGTFDPTDVTGVVWGGNRALSTGTISLSMTEIHTLDRVTSLGGSASDPAGMKTLADGVRGNYQKTFPSAATCKQKLGIGDGSTQTYWKDDSAVMAAYVPGPFDSAHKADVNFAADLEIHASASDTIDFTGQVWKGTGATPFLVNASSSPSATYITSGLTIIGRAVTFQDVFTAADGITFVNSTYTANNADLSGGCIFDNTLVTVTSEAELTDISNGTFRNRSGGGESAILITGNQTGTWTDKFLSVSNNTNDIEYSGTTNFNLSSNISLTVNNSSSGVLTIIAPELTLSINSDTATTLIRYFEDDSQTVVDSATGTTLDYIYPDTDPVDIELVKQNYVPVNRQNVTPFDGDFDVLMDFDEAYNPSHGLTITTEYDYVRATKALTINSDQAALDVRSSLADVIRTNSSYFNTPLLMVAIPGLTRIDLTDGMTITSMNTWKGAGMERFDSADTANPVEKWVAVKSVGDITGATPYYRQTSSGGATVFPLTNNVADEAFQYWSDPNHDGSTADGYDRSGYLLLKAFLAGSRQARVDVPANAGVNTMASNLYTVPMVNADHGYSGVDPGIIGDLTLIAGGTEGGEVFAYEIVDAGGNTGQDIADQINFEGANNPNNIIAGGTGLRWFELGDIVIHNSTAVETERSFEEGGTPVLVGFYCSSGGADHPDFTRFQADNGNYYTPAASIQVTAVNLLDTTRVLLWNSTASTAIENTTVTGGGGYSIVLETGTDYTLGDEIILLATYSLAGVYKQVFRGTATLTTANAAFTDSQIDWAEPNALSIDGSTVTECTTNYVQVQVEVDDGDDSTNKPRISAFICDAITTSDGIINWVSLGGNAAIRFISAGSALIDKAVADVEVDNIKVGTVLRVVDAFQLRASDGSSLIDNSTYSIEWDNGSEAVVLETGISGLTAAESTELFKNTSILQDTSDIQPKLGTPVADVSEDLAAIKSDVSGGEAEVPIPPAV